MKAWYEIYNDRYQSELESLERANIKYSIDDEAMAQKILRLSLHIQSNNEVFKLPEGQPIDLVVVFPDHYPSFRPEVYAYDLELERHHNPIGKNLCLIPRATEFWYTEMTLVDFLKEQLEKVIIRGNITDK